MTIPSAVAVNYYLGQGMLFYINENGIHSNITVADVFRSGRTVVFGGPAPFSRLDTEQAQLYERAANDLRALGIDRIIGVYCQDAFVMRQFAKHIQSMTGSSAVEFYADGDGSFIISYDLAHDFTNFGLGVRSERWCAVLDNGQVKWVEHDDYSTIDKTHVDRVISWLKSQ